MGEEFNYVDVAEEIIGNICNNIGVESIAEDAKISLCEKYKLRNYENAINQCDIVDIEIDYSFVEEFIKSYY